MRTQMPVGIDDFQKLIEKDYYFIDKTDFIRQIIDGHSEVTLITRPRRFGKTLNMSMLDWFFNIHKEKESQNLFKGLTIERAGEDYMKHRGQYPVLFLSLKEIRNEDWKDWPRMLQFIKLYLSRLYTKNDYLRDEDKLSHEQLSAFDRICNMQASDDELALALSTLIEIMKQYYGKPVILLLDEYDVPIQQAWESGYYKGCIGFMRQFLGSVLKGNIDLDFAILTGVLRISKESIFSGLNNLTVCSVMGNRYAEIFGFTFTEVEKMAKDLGMPSHLSELQRWYDGYHFGIQEIYNPWSIINYFDNGYLDDYWVNTSGNTIIRHMLRHLNEEREESLRTLLHGKSITAVIRENMIYEDIDRNEDALYTMLLTTGYLTPINKRKSIGSWLCELKIPNREVQDVFRIEILERINAGLSLSRFEIMMNDLMTGQAQNFEEKLSTYLRYLVSSYDAANKESFYHGFVLGMTALLVPDYIVESNRESGYGRFDIAILPKDNKKAGVVMEFKVAPSESELEAKAKEALQQIEDREYITEFEKRGIKDVWKYGIAFCGKKIQIVS